MKPKRKILLSQIGHTKKIMVYLLPPPWPKKRLLWKPKKPKLVLHPGTYESRAHHKNRPSKKSRTVSVRGHRPKGSAPSAPRPAIPGIRLISTTSNNVTTVTEQRPTAYAKNFSQYYTAHGDFKHPTAHRYDYTEIDYGSGVNFTGTAQNNSLTAGTQAWSMALSFAFPDLITSAYNQSLSRLYEQIRGDVDVSIDLAEFGKTQGMMRQTMKGMASLATTFRKMKRSNPRDWGNLWLEWTYGWKPLASTIYGGLHRALSGDISFARFIRSSGKERWNKVQVTSTGTPGGNDFVTFGLGGIYSVRMRCLYNIQNSRLNQLAGYSSLNPVSITWELIPYSFVVDWFVNVGGYLRNYESCLLYGPSFIEGYTSSLTVLALKEQDYGTYRNVPAMSTGYHSETGGTKKIGFARTVLGAAPPPRLPLLSPHLGTSRLLSAASLLGQMLHSLKHPELPSRKVWEGADEIFSLSPFSKSRKR